MSVWMQSAPYALREGRWHEQREALGDAVCKTIEEYAPGFQSAILHRQVLTPADLEEIYGMTGGHLYHAEMALDQIFFMRPIPGWARYASPIRNLSLCGAGTPPGGGITGDDLVPAVEAGVGWSMAIGKLDIGPSARYVRVVSNDSMHAFGSADLALFGVDVRFGRQRKARVVAPVTVERVEAVAAVHDELS